MLNANRLIYMTSLVLTMQSAIACAGPSQAHADPHADPGDPPASTQPSVVNSVAFSEGQVHQLSGITHLADNDFLVVSDKGGLIVRATVEIDSETGEIKRAKLGEPLATGAGKDLEDIAMDPSKGVVYVCDESGSWITSHRLSDGKRIKQFRTPYQLKSQRPRPNLGLESLAWSNGFLWTANEEASPGDGDRATQNAGTRVRVQSFTQDIKPGHAYFYLTDPHMGDKNIIQRAQSGVVGLVSLPDRRLIVMERALGGHALPAFRIRLYLVDTNVTETGDGTPALLTKKLLLEINTGRANYEGITLGPRLNNGDYTLLLVCDDGGGEGYNPQRLMAVRLPAAIIDGLPPARHGTD